MKRLDRIGWLLLMVGSLIVSLVVSCGDDPVKPEESEYSMATVTDPETEVGMVLMKDGGEQIAVLGEKDEDGEITQPTGGAYVDPSGETIAYTLGADGLPEFVYTNSQLFHLCNYTDTTVDVCGVDTLLVPHSYGVITLDSTQKANLEKLTNFVAFLTDPIGGWKNMSTDEKIDYASLAGAVACCVVGMATPLGWAGCAFTAGSITSKIGFDNVKWLANCAYMLNPQCRSFELDLLDSGVKKVKNIGGKIIGYLPF